MERGVIHGATMPATTDLSYDIFLDGRPCLIPGPEHGIAFRKANSYWCPLGPMPGRAWVLITRADFDAIRNTATHTLALGPLSIAPLYLVTARRISPGEPNDASAAYLVELVDLRILGVKFSDTGLLRVTPPTTWQLLLDALWATLPTVFGAAPTLPTAVPMEAAYLGTPPRCAFVGQNSWRIISEILASFSCAAAFNPTADGIFSEPFSYVSMGAVQSVTIPSTQEYDAEFLFLETGAPYYPLVTPSDGAYVAPFHGKPSGNVDGTAPNTFDGALYTGGPVDSPEKIRVLNFPDGLAGGKISQIDQATVVTGAVAGTIYSVGDGLALYATPAGFANKATRLVDQITQDATTVRYQRALTGIVTTVKPGSLIKAVLWRCWGPNAGGSVTEVVCHPGLPVTPEWPREPLPERSTFFAYGASETVGAFGVPVTKALAAPPGISGLAGDTASFVLAANAITCYRSGLFKVTLDTYFSYAPAAAWQGSAIVKNNDGSGVIGSGTSGPACDASMASAGYVATSQTQPMALFAGDALTVSIESAGGARPSASVRLTISEA